MGLAGQRNVGGKLEEVGRAGDVQLPLAFRYRGWVGVDHGLGGALVREVGGRGSSGCCRLRESGWIHRRHLAGGRWFLRPFFSLRLGMFWGALWCLFVELKRLKRIHFGELLARLGLDLPHATCLSIIRDAYSLFSAWKPEG